MLFIQLVFITFSFYICNALPATLNVSEPIMVQINSEDELNALVNLQRQQLQESHSQQQQHRQQQQHHQQRQHQQPQQKQQQQKNENRPQNMTGTKSIINKLVSKINDNIQSRRATLALCRRVHGAFVKGKCVIAEDNIEMVINSVFADRRPNVNQETYNMGFGNPDLSG